MQLALPGALFFERFPTPPRRRRGSKNGPRVPRPRVPRNHPATYPNTPKVVIWHSGICIGGQGWVSARVRVLVRVSAPFRADFGLSVTPPRVTTYFGTRIIPRNHLQPTPSAFLPPLTIFWDCTGGRGRVSARLRALVGVSAPFRADFGLSVTPPTSARYFGSRIIPRNHLQQTPNAFLPPLTIFWDMYGLLGGGIRGWAASWCHFQRLFGSFSAILVRVPRHQNSGYPNHPSQPIPSAFIPPLTIFWDMSGGWGGVFGVGLGPGAISGAFSGRFRGFW